MDDILETDENFEIVASTFKCIYDQTCRKCGCLNRVIFYQLKDGRVQHKLRIEHGKGDTATYLWNRQKEQKRQGDAQSSQTDKRFRDGDSGSDPQCWPVLSIVLCALGGLRQSVVATQPAKRLYGSESSGSRQWRR